MRELARICSNQIQEEQLQCEIVEYYLSFIELCQVSCGIDEKESDLLEQDFDWQERYFLCFLIASTSFIVESNSYFGFIQSSKSIKHF